MKAWMLLCLATGPALFQQQARLTGTWTPVSVERSSITIPAEELKSAKLIVTNQTMTMMQGDEVQLRMAYEIDPTTSPKGITVTMLEGDRLTLKGIYDLKGRVLRICLNNDPTGERPKEFKTAEGDAQSLLVMH